MNHRQAQPRQPLVVEAPQNNQPEPQPQRPAASNNETDEVIPIIVIFNFEISVILS